MGFLQSLDNSAKNLEHIIWNKKMPSVITKQLFIVVIEAMGGKGKSKFWSKFILLDHLVDLCISLITKISKNFEFPPFSIDCFSYALNE